MAKSKLTKKELRILDNGENWMAVGASCESVSDDVPDLRPEGAFAWEGEEDGKESYEKTCAFNEEIARRLNHYPTLLKEHTLMASKLREIEAAMNVLLDNGVI